MIRIAVTELRLLTREPLLLVVSLLFPILLMVLLLASFSGDTDPVFVGMDGREFYVTSYLGAAVAVMGFMGTPTRLSGYRHSGVLRRFRAAGVPASSIVAGQAVVTAVLAAVGAAAMVTLGFIGFDLTSPESVAGVVAGVLVGILGFAGVGALLGAVMPSPGMAQGVGLLLFFGTFFLVGGGPPPGILPDALNTVAGWTPTGLLVDAIRSPWAGQGTDAPALVALAVIAVVGYGLAIRRLARD